jgi:3-phytase
MKVIISALIASVLCIACDRTDRTAEPVAPAAGRSVAASGSSAPSGPGALANAAFWSDPGAPGSALILGAAGTAGVELYTPDGRRVGSLADVDAGFVAVVPGQAATPLVVVYDRRDAAIRAYRLDRDALELQSVMPEPLNPGDELTGLCHYHSRLSDSEYLYAVTDAGLILHYELFAQDGDIGGRLLRTIPFGKGAGFCAVDSGKGTLYVSDESVGIWRLGAEPESDTEREPFAMRSPWGTLSDEVKGIGLYRVNDKRSYLVAADVGEDRIAVYQLPGAKLLGRVQVPGLSEAEGVTVTNLPLGDTYPHGLVAVADEDAAGGSDLKFIGWPALASALGLQSADAGTKDADRAKAVRPVLETEVAASYGDAADDPAIWLHPDEPSKSLIIGTDKQLGLYVFDLQGRTVQVLPDGRMNNVDLRSGFPLGGEEATLVAASNRSNDSISVYRIDVGELQLVESAAGTLNTGFSDPYGLCMYHSARSGEFYVFVNEGDEGTYRQWRLFDNGEGKVAVERVREFEVGSQAEGCVADDELGHLYVDEEDVGLWKYAAEPDAGNERTLIDGTGKDGRLEADVEGVSLWVGENGEGYLVVSNQGADNYAVYRRAGDNAYVGHFHVVANAAENVDGASETDGLDVLNAALGERYPSGLLVVQDGRNIAPEERQNFKYVSWADVMGALQE